MKPKYYQQTAASILFLSVVAVPTVVAAEETEKNFSMTVFHTNDTHAHLENIPQFSALLKEKRSATPNNVLLHAGDAFSGTLYFNEFLGQADLAFFNYLEYDAFTFGNHEFDLGRSSEGHQALADFIKGAKFPIVSANVNLSTDPKLANLQERTVVDQPENGKVYNGIVKEINGEKVGIFGLTTEETVNIASPEKVIFTNYITEAKAAVNAFEEMGVNKIIAVTHIGFDDNSAVDNDQELAKQVPGIDIIVGGHTHSNLPEPVVFNQEKEPVIIVQAEQYFKYLGQLDVTFDKNGVIQDYQGVLHEVDAEGPKDPKAEEMLKPYKEKVNEMMMKPTGGEATVFLNGLRDQSSLLKTLIGGVRTNETNLGNIITDGMLSKAKEIDPEVSIAFQNGGGIRASIDKGPVTYGEVLTVLPFGNNLAIIELSGKELKETFEHAVRQFPKENGGFLHVAGMQVIFDGQAEPGKRIVSLKINEEEVQDNKMYKAATNVFTARGGDGFEALGKAYAEGRASEPGFSDWENLANHVKTLGDISQGIEGRILATVPYKDLATSNWAYPYVSDIFYRGIIAEDKTFNPGKMMTRAEMVAWIVQAHGLSSKQAAPFTDLKNVSNDSKAQIAAAYEHGLIEKGDGQFRPSEAITRAEAALLFKKAYENYTNQTYSPTTTAPFKDLSKVNSEFATAITMLHELDIATGEGQRFMPDQALTRQQAAKMVSNFVQATKRVTKSK